MEALRDKGVVVTGAAGGIGRAIAEACVAAGARVVVTDLDAERLLATATDLGAYAVPSDISTNDGIEAVIELATAHLGGIDVWVGNAGIQGGLGLETPDETWQLAHDVNVMAHVRAARLLVPAWLESGGGRFVVTASAAGLLTMIGAAPYSVTKHAAVAFAEWLAATYGHRGIDVHCLCPQGVDTAIYRDAGAVQGLLAADGLLTPAEVAAALLEAIEQGRHQVLPHPQVRQYAVARAIDTDAWLRGMQRLQRRYDAPAPAPATRPTDSRTIGHQ